MVEYLEQLETQFGVKPEITERFKKKEENEKVHEEEDDYEEEGQGRGLVDFRKIEREMQKQSLDARLEVVHTQVFYTKNLQTIYK